LEENKPKLLLLHGALGTCKTFDTFLPILSLKYKVYCFDFRGHGVYSSDSALSSAILIKQLIDFIENNELNKISIFGYSMGGFVALLASLIRPEIVGKIITLGTKYNWDETIALDEVKKLKDLLELPTEHPFIKQLILFHGEGNFQNCINLTGILMKELGANKYLNENTIPKINNQVLLLIGEKDHMVSINETSKVHHQLSHADIVVLPNTKHPFEKVNFHELYMIIDKFLSG
jgi:pimeloyl-ACP methyl ester carboxylesterase